MKPLRALLLLSLLIGPLALLGCRAQGSGKVTVGFVTNNPEQFWLLVEAGAKKAAEDEDVELLFRRPQNATAAEQKEIIDAMLAQGVRAVSISVKDPENQTEYLNRVAKRVPLLAVDNDADASDRRCYIGTDNVKAGKAVGELVKEAMPEGGLVALFVGQTEPINARERTQGVMEALGIKKGETKSADGKYRLASKEPYTDNAKRDRAKERASEVLGLFADEPSLCLVGLWAYNPPAILEAVKQRKLEGKVKIVGFDEDIDTLRGIEAGHVYATVVQNPYEFGHRSVKVMAALARKKDAGLPADGKLYIPERIVNRDGGKGRLKSAEFRPQIQRILGIDK